MVTPRQHLALRFNDVVHLDYKGPFPASPQGYRHLLVAIDARTGWVEAEGVPDKQVNSFIKAFERMWVTRLGTPVSLITDKGDAFMTNVARSYYNSMRIFKFTSAAANPQGNGRVERLIRSIADLLAAGIAQLDQPEEWYDILPLALFVIRTTMRVHSKRPSPDLSFLGFRLNSPLDVLSGRTNVPEPSVLAVRRMKIFKWLTEETLRYIQTFDSAVDPNPAESFQPGDLVYLLERPNYRLAFGQLPFKTSPWQIDSKIGPTTYTLRDPTTHERRRGTVSARRLLPYFEVPSWESVDKEISRLITLGDSYSSTSNISPQLVAFASATTLLPDSFSGEALLESQQ